MEKKYRYSVQEIGEKYGKCEALFPEGEYEATWKDDEGRIFAKAEYEIVASYSESTNSLEIWGTENVLKNPPKEELFDMALKVAEKNFDDCDFVISEENEKGIWYYAVYNFQEIEGSDTFKERVEKIVNEYGVCMELFDKRKDNEEYYEYVRMLQTLVDEFLDDYINESLESIAEFIGETGVGYEKALKNLSSFLDEEMD